MFIPAVYADALCMIILGMTSTMAGTIWGVFVWKELKGARCNHQAAAGTDVCLFHRRPCVRGACAGGETKD
jgi:hypothetical protein